jgi:tetratricopeptide (TPR) repeat protein
MVGFENVSCDCVLSTLIEKNQELIIQSLKSNSINCTAHELDFIRAVFYYFLDSGNFGQEQKGVYAKALSFINSFLEENINSEIGYYLKGRILSGLDNFEEAISELDRALTIRKTPRVHYRIGRIKEQKLDQFGVDHLYQSILLNPSSLCANRWFKNIADKRDIKLTIGHKLLANKFNNTNTLEYLKTINQLLINGEVELTNNSTLTASVAFVDFINVLKADEKHFGINSSDDDNDDDYNDDDYNDDDYDDDGPDDYDDGPGAYGYDSWDEMAFYSAFDGDIDAWNNYNQ